MKKTLKMQDFKRNKKHGYFYFKNDKVEICIEPCLNGFDVAIYDLNQNLLMPKKCTDVKELTFDGMDEAIKKAVVYANEFYTLFNLK